MPKAALSLVSAAVLCVSCTDAGNDQQSLVGAEELPSAEALARETLYIVRGGSAYGGHSLTYEWRPDNSITVTHEYSDGAGRGSVNGRELLRVPPDVAAQVRHVLLRVRPAKLEGVEQDIRPLGCERRGPHDFGNVSVGFINEGEAAGIEDDEVGIFQLPFPESCSTPAADEARRVVRHALQLLPKSKVAFEYERRFD